MEERDLKEYIVKLNDRNIQRQRETGFTLYAILGATIFCFFYLVDNIYILQNIKNNTRFLNVAIIASNSLLTLFFFYLSYGIATRRQSITKIFPYQEPLKIEFIDFCYFLPFAIICFSNFIFLNHTQNSLHYSYLLVFGIITGLNLILPFAVSIFRKIRISIKKKKGQSIEIIDFTYFNKEMIKVISISSLIYAILLSTFSLIVFLNIKLGLDIKSVSKTIEYIVIFYALFFIIKTTAGIKSKQNDNNQLEDFEKEIFFENITNEEIAKKFEKDFSGIPFSKWLTNKNIEIIDFFDKKRQEFIANDLFLIEVDKIDKRTMPFEYNGRLKQVIDVQLQLLKEATDYVQKIATHFSNLKNFASLNEEEVSRLNTVQTFLNQNISGFNNRYSNLSRQIAERQNQ